MELERGSINYPWTTQETPVLILTSGYPVLKNVCPSFCHTGTNTKEKADAEGLGLDKRGSIRVLLGRGDYVKAYAEGPGLYVREG